MGWDFETEIEFAKELEWMSSFVREEVDPLEHVLAVPTTSSDPERNALGAAAAGEVKARKLWACHLGPELGGPGYGQVKLALLNEILGRSNSARWCSAARRPTTGNAEILAHLRHRRAEGALPEPLLDNEIVSCFSMTEPQGGADPLVFTTRADRGATTGSSTARSGSPPTRAGPTS